VLACLIVSLQGSAQAIMPLDRFVHFSDYVIGHSRLAMIGFGSFVALGGLFHASRLTPGCRYHRGWRVGHSGCSRWDWREWSLT
jgi:cbb3-type cytochrome oxidase subunit 1